MILTKEKIEKFDVDHEIDTLIKSGRLDELLIVVPTNRKLRQLKKELISLSPGATVTHLNIETIGTLSQKLLEKSRKFIVISEAVAAVFIKQSIKENDLRYFSQYKGEIPQGTQDRIRNVIGEYKKQGITPAILDSEALKLEGSQKLKAVDISSVYKTYLKKSQALSAFDTGDVYSGVDSFSENEFRENFKSSFASVKMAIVFGFDEFTFPEIKIFSRCADLDYLKLFISFDYYNYNSLIFSHLDKCYERLGSFGFNKIHDLNEGASDRFINTVRERLFLKRKLAKISDFKNKLVKLTAPDREKEIHLVAKEIKQLLGSGAQPETICLAFNQVNNYAPLVRDIFKVYGVPFNLTDRLSLSSSPVVNTVINFLEILENDFYYKNILRSFTTGFAEIKDFDVASLQTAAANLRIISGKQNWLATLGEATREYSANENLTEQQKKIYRKALNGIRILENILKPFEKNMTIDEFYTEFKNLVVKLKIPVKLLEASAGREEENIKALTTMLEITEEIFELLKLEHPVDKTFNLNYFLDQLRTACSRARFNVKEKSGYGVLVTAVNEIRGLNFDYLFIGGMNDGDFPTRYSPEIFFSGSFQKKEMIHQTEERYHFYQALSCWNKKLYLTAALNDGERELETSIFLKEFLLLFEMTEKNADSYTGTIFSNEELLKYIGANLGKNISFESENIDIEQIKSSVEIAAIRKIQPQCDSAFNGIITGSDDLIKFELEKLKSREYSVSQLETYARCPFKFFLERILFVQPIEEPAEEVEALEVGNILHSLLYDFYTVLRAEKIILPDCSDEDFKKSETILFDIAEKYIADQIFALPLSFIEKEKIFGTEKSRRSSLLYKFLENERADNSGFIPKYFETAFGTINRDGADTQLMSGTVNIGGVNLRGKIDRIEINEESLEFNVVDYKTGGKKPPAKDLFDGISMQLPVYLLAVEKILREATGRKYTPKDMSIYSLKYSSDDFGKKNIRLTRKKEDPPEIREELLQQVEENIRKYVENITGGRFNLSTLPDRDTKVCNWCGFKSVCRITETEG